MHDGEHRWTAGAAGVAFGRQVAKVDLGWPEHRLAVEYDGLWHAEPEQFGKDRARLNRLTAAGWRVVLVTAADPHHPERRCTMSS